MAKILQRSDMDKIPFKAIEKYRKLYRNTLIHLIIILVNWLATMVMSSCFEDLSYFCIIGNCFQPPVCQSV